MAWTLCPLPKSPSVASKPVVYLTNDKSGKRLKISKPAWELAGFRPHDSLVMERDGERFRIRRAEENEPVYGILSKPKTETTAVFTAGGHILFAAGCAPARASASCGDGWIEFDAKAMFDAARSSRSPAPQPAVVVSQPAPSVPPSGETIKPWALRTHPAIAVRILRLIVNRVENEAIKRELDLTTEDVLNVRRMVGETKIGALRAASEAERDVYYQSALTRWTARFDSKVIA